MHLAAVEQRQAVKGSAAVVVEEAEDGEGDEQLVGVEARVTAMQHVDLGVLDGFDHLMRDELHLVVDAFYSSPSASYYGTATGEPWGAGCSTATPRRAHSALSCPT